MLNQREYVRVDSRHDELLFLIFIAAVLDVCDGREEGWEELG